MKFPQGFVPSVTFSDVPDEQIAARKPSCRLIAMFVESELNLSRSFERVHAVLDDDELYQRS